MKNKQKQKMKMNPPPARGSARAWQPDAGSAPDTQFAVQVGRVVGQRKIMQEDKTGN